jgi:Ca2+-binding RTX toxin-like protein
MSFHRNRRSSIASFSPLEARRLMAVDLTGSASYETGFCGAGDLVDVDVSLKQTAGGGSSTNFPVSVSVILSKDKTLGNADDITFTSTVFLLDASAKTQTQQVVGHIDEGDAAGSYYTAVRVDEMGVINESNENNNVTWSAGQDTTIITQALASTTISGSSKGDRVTVRENWHSLVVTVNGKSSVIDRSDAPVLTFNLGSGNDSFSVFRNEHGVTASLHVNGGAGNDVITTGDGTDRIDGGSGNDKLAGGKNGDWIYGSSGNDAIDGGEGADTLIGGSGKKDKAKKDDTDFSLAGIENLY